jgi:hypothetical protein
MREPFPVMQDFGSVFFLFFPMVREFHRAPVRDVTSFSFAEYSFFGELEIFYVLMSFSSEGPSPFP